MSAGPGVAGASAGGPTVDGGAVADWFASSDAGNWPTNAS